MRESIKVHHLARCGSHAIISWMARSMIKDPSKNVNQGEHYNNINEELLPRDVDFWDSGGESGSAVTIYSTENFDLRGHDDVFSCYDIPETYIIIRDYRNWIASSVCTPGLLSKMNEAKQSETMKRFGYKEWFCGTMNRLEMYKQYLREILGETTLISDDIRVIDYDLWVSNIDYRRSLGFGEVEVDTSRVSSYCGGSSFDDMDVLNRWREVPDKVEKFVDDDMKYLYNEYRDTRDFDYGVKSVQSFSKGGVQ